MVVKGRLVLTVCLYFQLRQPIPLDFNPITAVKVKLFVLILETIVETLEISETSSPIAAIADSAQLIPHISCKFKTNHLTFLSVSAPLIMKIPPYARIVEQRLLYVKVRPRVDALPVEISRIFRCLAHPRTQIV